jgi:hypothetical protein
MAAKLDPAKMGRRVATALYWALTVYVIGAGLVSVVPQTFWAPVCGESLRALHRDLLAGAAAEIRAPEADAGRDWLDRWDERYRALAGTCEGRSSYSLLGQLRERAAEDLRFQAEDAAVVLSAIERDGP